MSLNSRLKAIYIIGQRKAFYRSRTPKSNCIRKESVDSTSIQHLELLTEKIIKSIRITMWTSDENKKTEPVGPVQKNI